MTENKNGQDMVNIICPDGTSMSAPRGSEQEYRDALKEVYPDIENSQFVQHETGTTVEFRPVASHKG